MRGKQQEKSFNNKMRIFFRKYSIYIFLILLLILVPLVIYYSTIWDAHKQINELSVEGNEFVPQEIIKKLVNDSLYKKEKGKIDLREIRQIIQDYPFVANADVMFASGKKIKVILKMRHPAAKLKKGRGEMLFTDANGRLLPYKFFENFSFLPVIDNCFRGDSLDTARFNSALHLLNLIEKNYDISYGLLKEIKIGKSDDMELTLKKNGINVVFGDSNETRSKLDKLETFLEKRLVNNAKREIKTIDLKWSNQLVVR